MSVLKVYYKIMKSHWLTLMIYMSIFFTVFFVFGMSASERSDIKMYEGSKPNIAVLDRDGSSLSEGLLTYLGTQANIKHKNVSNSDAQDALFYADVSAIITIPEGFEEEFASGKEAVSMNQRPDDVNGVLLQQTINKYLDTMHAYEKLYPKQGISELHTRVQKNLNTTAEVKMSDSEEV
ncbi:ABC transporter permease, partial [[Clostridium] innocuum]|nr:ABC transporter permease [[Clostridium] innocuum]